MIIDVTIETMMSPSRYMSVSPSEATAPTSKIDVKGPPRRRANAAPSIHVTKRITGTLGNARLMARPIIVQENKMGKVGPPRNPPLNATARRTSFSTAYIRSVAIPNVAAMPTIEWIWVSPEKATSGTK